MWDKNAAVEYARKHAHAGSLHKCAFAVRKAIEAGGIIGVRANYAKDFGPSLVHAGFYEITDQPQKGDVAVIQSIPESIPGHTCIFDGKVWISDFVQHSGMYPGPAYRKHRPPFKIYRHN